MNKELFKLGLVPLAFGGAAILGALPLQVKTIKAAKVSKAAKASNALKIEKSNSTPTFKASGISKAHLKKIKASNRKAYDIFADRGMQKTRVRYYDLNGLTEGEIDDLTITANFPHAAKLNGHLVDVKAQYTDFDAYSGEAKNNSRNPTINRRKGGLGWSLAISNYLYNGVVYTGFHHFKVSYTFYDSKTKQPISLTTSLKNKKVYLCFNSLNGVNRTTVNWVGDGEPSELGEWVSYLGASGGTGIISNPSNIRRVHPYNESSSFLAAGGAPFSTFTDYSGGATFFRNSIDYPADSEPTQPFVIGAGYGSAWYKLSTDIIREPKQPPKPPKPKPKPDPGSGTVIHYADPNTSDVLKRTEVNKLHLIQRHYYTYTEDYEYYVTYKHGTPEYHEYTVEIPHIHHYYVYWSNVYALKTLVNNKGFSYVPDSPKLAHFTTAHEAYGYDYGVPKSDPRRLPVAKTYIPYKVPTAKLSFNQLVVDTDKYSRNLPAKLTYSFNKKKTVNWLHGHDFDNVKVKLSVIDTDSDNTLYTKTVPLKQFTSKSAKKTLKFKLNTSNSKFDYDTGEEIPLKVKAKISHNPHKREIDFGNNNMKSKGYTATEQKVSASDFSTKAQNKKGKANLRQPAETIKNAGSRVQTKKEKLTMQAYLHLVKRTGYGFNANMNLGYTGITSPQLTPDPAVTPTEANTAVKVGFPSSLGKANTGVDYNNVGNNELGYNLDSSLSGSQPTAVTYNFVLKMVATQAMTLKLNGHDKDITNGEVFTKDQYNQMLSEADSDSQTELKNDFRSGNQQFYIPIWHDLTYNEASGTDKPLILEYTRQNPDQRLGYNWFDIDIKQKLSLASYMYVPENSNTKATDALVIEPAFTGTGSVQSPVTNNYKQAQADSNNGSGNTTWKTYK